VAARITPSPEAFLDQTIAGYRLTRVIGRGGTSVVFQGQLVTDDVPDLPEQAALKVLDLPEDLAPDVARQVRARFLRTARAAQRLRHPHIMPVLRSGEEDGRAYMVMPLLTGGTLADMLASHPRGLPLDRAGTYLSQIADALDYAHRRGVIHRDIKPSNLLLDEQGAPVLADFGIARLFATGTDAQTIILGQSITITTGVGQVLGTPCYMAPEQIRSLPVQPATDIYALGIVVYQLVTGRLPFQGESPFAVAIQQIQDAPQSPREIRPTLSAAAEAAIMRALAKRPEDRFRSATAFAEAFSSQSDSDAQDGAGDSPDRRSRGFARSLVLAGIALVLLGLGFVAQHDAMPPRATTQSTATPAPTATDPLAALPALTTLPPYSLGDDSIVIGWQGNVVLARRQSDGVLLWQYVADGAIQGRPVIAQGVLYITTAHATYALRPSDGTVIDVSQANV
jgi:serine/threonine protein kinase